MKILVLILTILLVGCFASSQMSYNKKVDTSELDTKIVELRKVEEAIDNKHKALEKYVAELGRDRLVKITPQAESKAIEKPRAPQVTSIELPNMPAMSTAPDVQVYKQVPKPLPKQDSILQTVTSQLYKASAVFTVPNKANINEDIKAQLIIDPNKTIDELKKSVTGQIQSAETIKVSKIVIAKIEAPDFIVTNLTTNEQALSDTDKTEWLWSLRPKTPGLHEINLTITAEITIDSKFSKYHIRTFDKQVMIEITPLQIVESWWSKYWQWVMSTLILPLAAFIYKKHTSKKEQD